MHYTLIVMKDDQKLDEFDCLTLDRLAEAITEVAACTRPGDKIALTIVNRDPAPQESGVHRYDGPPHGESRVGFGRRS